MDEKMMIGIAITSKGIEDICAKEISEIIGAETQIGNSFVKFKCSGFEDFCLLCYQMHTASRILYVPDDANQPEKLFDDLSNDNIQNLGIDFAGFDLSKRQYRTRQSPDLLDSKIAYSLVRIAGISRGETLLEPITSDGVISIEASLSLEGISPSHFVRDKFAFLHFDFLSSIEFDKLFLHKSKPKEKASIYCYSNLLKNVFIAKKNAVVAGLGKKIHFSKVDLKWIDLKHEANSVDKVIAYIPSRDGTQKETGKSYEELLNAASIILSKEGKIVLALDNLFGIEMLAKKYSFGITETREVVANQKKLIVVALGRNPKQTL